MQLIKGIDRQAAAPTTDATEAAPSNPKLRYSMGVYDSAEKLWRAVLQLIERGFSPDQISIACSARTFDASCACAALSSEDRLRIAPILARVSAPSTPTQPDTLVASTGAIRTLIQGEQLQPMETGIAAVQSASTSARRALRDVRLRLDEQIMAGATVLAVASISRSQQWLSTRILLEASCTPVQTHEFRETAKH